MSIIQAYKSDSDGELFEDKKKYVAHLRKLSRQRQQERAWQKMKDERQAFMNKMGQVESVDELYQFIKDNWNWFFYNGATDRMAWWGGKDKPALHEYVAVEIDGLRWSENLSNSHSCPVGGVQNWGREPGKPTGYPGWSGRIEIKVRPPKKKYRGKEYLTDGFGSSYFANTIINTGSGGGGTGKEFASYSYEVKLWATDFPVMFKRLREKQIWEVLGAKTESV